MRSRIACLAVSADLRLFMINVPFLLLLMPVVMSDTAVRSGNSCFPLRGSDFLSNPIEDRLFGRFGRLEVVHDDILSVFYPRSPLG